MKQNSSFIFLAFSYQCSSVCIRGFKAFLCPQAREDSQRRLFCALAAFAYWTDARWAPVLARTCGDQFARPCEQQIVRAVQRFGEPDSSPIRVIDIQIRLEELFFGKDSYRF